MDDTNESKKMDNALRGLLGVSKADIEAEERRRKKRAMRIRKERRKRGK